jgi:hypothetical protein
MRERHDPRGAGKQTRESGKGRAPSGGDGRFGGGSVRVGTLFL